jgi:hypothetical protein
MAKPRRYAEPIERVMWSTPPFSKLSPAAKLVYLALRQGPRGTSLPVLVETDAAMLRSATGHPEAVVVKALREMEQTTPPMVVVDEDYRIIGDLWVELLPGSQKSKDTLRGWWRVWEQLPASPLRDRLVPVLRAVVDLDAPEMKEEWERTFGHVCIRGAIEAPFRGAFMGALEGASMAPLMAPSEGAPRGGPEGGLRGGHDGSRGGAPAQAPTRATAASDPASSVPRPTNNAADDQGERPRAPTHAHSAPGDQHGATSATAHNDGNEEATAATATGNEEAAAASGGAAGVGEARDGAAGTSATDATGNEGGDAAGAAGGAGGGARRAGEWPLELGAPANGKQREVVQRHLRDAMLLLGELNAARKRVQPSSRGLRPAYTSLAGIAGRLAAGKTVEECRHVIAVGEAEARARGSLEYFDAVSPWRPENFERLVARSPSAPPRPPPNGAARAARPAYRDEAVWGAGKVRADG